MSLNLLYIVLNMKGGLEYASITQHPGSVGRVYNIVYGCCNIQGMCVRLGVHVCVVGWAFIFVLGGALMYVLGWAFIYVC